MKALHPHCIGDVFQKLFEFIDRDIEIQKHSHPGELVSYYFRGEKHNFENPRDNDASDIPPIPRLFLPQNQNILKNEKKIFDEVLRTFPEAFRDDVLTIDKLARMQHYDYMTRLLDVTQKIPTALAMLLPSVASDEDTMKETGFVHIYRVRDDKIKCANGDTAILISNLVRMRPEQICLKKTKETLGMLAYEAQMERPGIYFEKDDEIGQRLIRDIQQVWCIRPDNNSPRINFQRGEFFLYGCKDQKEPLDPTFDETDYVKEDAPSYGIARIGAMAISPTIKQELRNRQDYLDIGLDRMYPDFHFHAMRMEEKFNPQENKK